jgi:hypothetical protein
MLSCGPFIDSKLFHVLFVMLRRGIESSVSSSLVPSCLHYSFIVFVNGTADWSVVECNLEDTPSVNALQSKISCLNRKCRTDNTANTFDVATSLTGSATSIKTPL